MNHSAHLISAPLRAARKFHWNGIVPVLVCVILGITIRSAVASRTAMPDDPAFRDASQWYLQDLQGAQLHFQQAWDLTRGDPNIHVAVIDTGVDAAHEDLNTRLAPGYDFVSGDSTPEDNEGHGTRIAGIIGAATDNATGIAGITWTGKIMPLKIIDNAGGGDNYNAIFSRMETAIRAAMNATPIPPRVINISMGGACPPDRCSAEVLERLHDAVREAYARGIVIVAATGNSNEENILYPARFPEVIAVGATNYSDERCSGVFLALNCAIPNQIPLWSGSNYGSELDLVAPGQNIYTTKPGGYGFFSGTSYAAPQVSALVALMLSKNPNLTPRQIGDILQRTAYKKQGCGVECVFSERGEEGGWNRYVGFGRIDAYRAVQAVADPPTLPSIRLERDGALVNKPAFPAQGAQVALTLRLQDRNATPIWGPELVTTDSQGNAAQVIFDGAGPGTYALCVKREGQPETCKPVTLTVGVNPAVDLNEGTQVVGPADVEVKSKLQ